MHWHIKARVRNYPGRLLNPLAQRGCEKLTKRPVGLITHVILQKEENVGWANLPFGYSMYDMFKCFSIELYSGETSVQDFDKHVQQKIRINRN